MLKTTLLGVFFPNIFLPLKPYSHQLFFPCYVWYILTSFSPQLETIFRFCSFWNLSPFQHLFSIVIIVSVSLSKALWRSGILFLSLFHSCLRLLQVDFHSSEIFLFVEQLFSSWECHRIDFTSCFTSDIVNHYLKLAFMTLLSLGFTCTFPIFFSPFRKPLFLCSFFQC